MNTVRFPVWIWQACSRLIVSAILFFCLTAQAAPIVSEPGPGGVRIKSDRIFGNFYARQGSGQGPAVILLGGSEGGLMGVPTSEALLADGYSVLSLAYFGAPRLPRTLDRIPLEYFANALKWLRKQPGVDEKRIAIMGVSKGAEAALLIAVRQPDIAAVVAGAPQSVVWIAPDSCGKKLSSSWIERGKALPALPCGRGSSVTDSLSAYRAGLRLLPKHPDARIPVELIKAPILLECGEADTLGPSCEMARQIQSKAREGSVQLLAYPEAGHASFGTPIAASNPAFARLGLLGGTSEGNALARADGWPKVLDFLNARLRNTN